MKTFLITGVSSGLGRAFAVRALEAGHRVVGTVRKPQDAKVFEGLAPDRAHARLLDVTDDAAVSTTVAEVEETVGPIDVVIANAGYGIEGIFEETPMGGLMAVPGMAAYCASKFAAEGMLESIRKEVAGFGIRVTAIEPGSFRTDWAGRSMTRAEHTIADYDALFDPIRAARLAASGNQLGNPEKAADAVLAILDTADPPAHLVLGSDALRLIGEARAAVDDDIRRWENLSRSTDFRDGAQLASN